MIKYKNDEVKRRAEMLNATLISILIEMVHFCEQRGMDFVVTETMTTEREDKKLNRVSSSHREGRAIDIRTKDWDENFISDFISYFIIRHGEKGAIQASTSKPKLIVDKSKTDQPHLHIQLNRKYAVTRRL
jgi:hypothetical protein